MFNPLSLKVLSKIKILNDTKIIHKTFSSVCRFKFIHAKNDVAMTFYSKNQTLALHYEVLEKQTKQIASILIKNNLQYKEVLLIYSSLKELLPMLLGCWEAGAIAIPFSQPKDISDMNFFNAIIHDSDVVNILIHYQVEQELKRSSLEFSQEINALNWMRIDNTQTKNNYNKLMLPEDQTALVMYPEFSSLKPLKISFSHKEIMTHLTVLQETLQLTESKEIVACPANNRFIDVISQLLFPIFLGCSYRIIEPESFMPNVYLWLDTIKKTRAPIMLAHAYTYVLTASLALNSQLKDKPLDSIILALIQPELSTSKDAQDLFFFKMKQAGLQPNAFMEVPHLLPKCASLYFRGLQYSQDEIITLTRNAHQAIRNQQVMPISLFLDQENKLLLAIELEQNTIKLFQDIVTEIRKSIFAEFTIPVFGVLGFEKGILPDSEESVRDAILSEKINPIQSWYHDQ